MYYDDSDNEIDIEVIEELPRAAGKNIPGFTITLCPPLETPFNGTEEEKMRILRIFGTFLHVYKFDYNILQQEYTEKDRIHYHFHCKFTSNQREKIMLKLKALVFRELSAHLPAEQNIPTLNKKAYNYKPLRAPYAGMIGYLYKQRDLHEPIQDGLMVNSIDDGIAKWNEIKRKRQEKKDALLEKSAIIADKKEDSKIDYVTKGIDVIQVYMKINNLAVCNIGIQYNSPRNTEKVIYQKIEGSNHSWKYHCTIKELIKYNSIGMFSFIFKNKEEFHDLVDSNNNNVFRSINLYHFIVEYKDFYIFLRTGDIQRTQDKYDGIYYYPDISYQEFIKNDERIHPTNFYNLLRYSELDTDDLFLTMFYKLFIPKKHKDKVLRIFSHPNAGKTTLMKTIMACLDSSVYGTIGSAGNFALCDIANKLLILCDEEADIFKLGLKRVNQLFEGYGNIPTEKKGKDKKDIISTANYLLSSNDEYPDIKIPNLLKNPLDSRITNFHMHEIPEADRTTTKQDELITEGANGKIITDLFKVVYPEHYSISTQEEVDKYMDKDDFYYKPPADKSVVDHLDQLSWMKGRKIPPRTHPTSIQTQPIIHSPAKVQSLPFLNLLLNLHDPQMVPLGDQPQPQQPKVLSNLDLLQSLSKVKPLSNLDILPKSKLVKPLSKCIAENDDNIIMLNLTECMKNIDNIDTTIAKCVTSYVNQKVKDIP